MSTAAKTIAALLFVALFGVVLTIPLRDSGPRSGPELVLASPSPEPSPSPTKRRREPTGPLRSKRFAHRYPKACLRPGPLPADGGLIAVHRGRSIAIITTSGAITASIGPTPMLGKSPLVSWSPSGRYLAAGSQGLMWTAEGESILAANGEFQHGFVWQSEADPWGWSPVADCGLSIESGAPGVRFGGALWVSSADPNVTSLGQSLINRGVESFAYSRDGRRLGLVLREGRVRSIWIANLERNRMQEVRRFERVTCCITLAGWSPDGRDLLYWAAHGASIAADGWPLEGIDIDGERSRYTPRVSSERFEFEEVMLTQPDWLVSCGDRLLAPLGGGRFPTDGRVVSFLRRNARPIQVGSGNFADVDPTCSPNGELIVVARSPAFGNANARPPHQTLYLLDADARGDRALRPITDDAGPSEGSPEWGPPRTGILYLSRSPERVSFWYLAEGEAQPRALGIRLGLTEGGFGLRRDSYDWSATPPDGLPVG
ncbi:MAG: hypothetical protein M3277_01375 [Actinomycetota bacterium]|nr:hypothetical protein [Actinomycetota bacterium]